MEHGKKISVICLTYNHRAYIEKCLQGFVAQKTNFPFEVIVHDDASTDGTVDIIKEYARNYPEIIHPVLQEHNQWSRGENISKLFIYPLIRGEYVAFCEGDDYWTDENKLQKQADFLDNHPDFAVCFHPVRIKWENRSCKGELFPHPSFRFNKEVLDLQDLLKHNFIQTNSVLMRWRFHKESVELIPDKIMPADWFIFLLHAELGKIGFLPEVMSVYRKHDAGIWHGARRRPEWFIRRAPLSIRFFEKMEEYFSYCHHGELVFLQHGRRLALEDQEKGKSLLRTLARCCRFMQVPAMLLFARGRKREYWKNYGKALLVSISWGIK
jgi:glycosyltransferase involved in cell wall biosynthesis